MTRAVATSISWAASASAAAFRQRSGALLLLLAAISCRLDRSPMHADSLPGRWVVIAPGESLELIAARAGVPVEDVLEVNGLRAEEIASGRIIFVLAPQTQAEVAMPATAVESGETPPFRWPLTGIRLVVGSPFGTRDGRPHEGIDLPAPTGTPVFAVADGRVAYAGNRIRGYGNIIVLRHGGDLLTVYAHNSVLLVSQGQPVRAGDRIALVGQSGRATGPHLHFEVRAGQIPQDPMRLLPQIPQ